MKHITLKLSIFSMILFSTFLWSCKEEPPVRSDDGINIKNYIVNPDTTITLTAEDFDFIGQTHNAILDHIYDNYRHYIDTSTNRDFIDSIIILASNDYMNNYYLYKDSLNHSPLNYSEMYSYHSSVPFTNSMNTNINLTGSNYSNETKSYLLQLDSIVKNATTPSVCLNAISDLNDNAFSNLDEYEIVHYMWVSSVAYNSVEYWSNPTKAGQWLALVNDIRNNTGETPKPSISWAAVGAADALALAGSASISYASAVAIGIDIAVTMGTTFVASGGNLAIAIGAGVAKGALRVGTKAVGYAAAASAFEAIWG